ISARRSPLRWGRNGGRRIRLLQTATTRAKQESIAPPAKTGPERSSKGGKSREVVARRVTREGLRVDEREERQQAHGGGLRPNRRGLRGEERRHALSAERIRHSVPSPGRPRRPGPGRWLRRRSGHDLAGGARGHGNRHRS